MNSVDATEVLGVSVRSQSNYHDVDLMVYCHTFYKQRG
jgi:hypothetical protein